MDWTPIINSVIASVLSAAIIAIAAFSVEPIRTFLRYRSHEYFLWVGSKNSGCTWDIQWEGTRLKIGASAVHNDHLAGVTLKINQAACESIGDWYVSDDFKPANKWPIKIKLAAIIRRKTADDRLYNVHFIVRRKRW